MLQARHKRILIMYADELVKELCQKGWKLCNRFYLGRRLRALYCNKEHRRPKCPLYQLYVQCLVSVVGSMF